MRFANHAKKRLILIFTIDRPLGIENLMTAVFGIGLSKHHQFHIRGIAAGLREGFSQIIDFIIAHGQPHRKVGIG